MLQSLRLADHHARLRDDLQRVELEEEGLRAFRKATDRGLEVLIFDIKAANCTQPGRDSFILSHHQEHLPFLFVLSLCDRLWSIIFHHVSSTNHFRVLGLQSPRYLG